MDDADEYMWTAPPFSSSSSLQKGLQDFEGSLRCPICGELFDVPVSIVTCHHTFCSKCIRDAFRSSIRSMKRSADCPVCREAVETGGADFKCLVPNRTVGNLVKQFRTFRSELRDQLAQVVQGSSSVSGTDSARTNVGAQPPREKRENADELSVRRKKKPKTFYKGLKLKQLKKLCADEGLSTVGTDAELRARHEEFILCYNAESDSYTPRSAAEIARQVARREEARKASFIVRNLLSLCRPRVSSFSHSHMAQFVIHFSVFCRSKLGKQRGMAREVTSHLWAVSRRAVKQREKPTNPPNYPAATRHSTWS